VVSADCNPRLLGECDQPGDLAGPHDLVAHQHVRDAAIHHRLRFADLLAADPDRTGRHLAEGDDGTFVGFGVRAQRDRRVGHGFRHTLDVPLKRVEIYEEGGRIHGVKRHSDLGGGVGLHGISLPGVHEVRIRSNSALGEYRARAELSSPSAASALRKGGTGGGARERKMA
jgi:hypothetical protein